MANINLSQINNKVVAYSKSADGKRKFKSYKDEVLNGLRPSKRGRRGAALLSEDDMVLVAYKMIDVLHDTAGDYPLPMNVLDHFESLDCTNPKPMGGRDGDDYIIYVHFTDDLSRPSLVGKDGTPTGEGIENIVALFDTGYQARWTVHGIWEDHDTDIIESLQSREPLGFMQAAIDDFNNNYGSDYGVWATLNTDEYRH